MTTSNAASPTRHFATLISPLDAADEPRWLQRATPQERRQWQDHHARGCEARRQATHAFSALPSLYQANRPLFDPMDIARITPHDLLVLRTQTELDTRYLDTLQAHLSDTDLISAREAAYLATLREELTLATLRGHLGKSGQRLLQWFIDAFPSGSPEFSQPGPFVKNQVAVCSHVQCLDDLALPDIILWGPDADALPCVAFIPGHPRHPVKQYASRAHCFAALRRDLLDPEFKSFFSRFIPLRHLPRLQAAWATRDAVLELPIGTVALTQGLRAFVMASMAERLLDDARYLVPTDADSATYLSSATADYPRALQTHLSRVMGAGLRPGEEDEGGAPSDANAAWRVIARPSGTGVEYWLPDLSRYRLPPAEVPSGPADARGLHPLGEHQAIKINGAFYRVVTDAADQWHIEHPDGDGHYRPRLHHNGHGAWHHRLERPQRWDRLTLLRRLGPRVTSFSDERLLTLARIGGATNAELRQVYLSDRPMPTLLQDVLERARINDEVALILQRIARGQSVPEADQVPQLKAFYLAIQTYYGRDSSAPRSKRGAGTPRTPAPGDDEHCQPPPPELYAQWFSLLLRAITTHRYELAQLNTDHAVLELQRRFPVLPLSVVQRFLDNSRASVREALGSRTGTLPLDAAEEVATLAQDTRLTRALEGFSVPASINTDTFILAFRLLEHLDHWPANTALLLRRGDRFGTPLAELGQTDVETTSVYLDDDEGWSATSATQVLLAQDMSEYGFYRALLHAIGERTAAALGFGLNEPERLHQALQELALARPTRARLILGLPVRRSWLSDVPVRAVQRGVDTLEAHLLAREPLQQRIAQLITHHPLLLSYFFVESYINHLLSRNEPLGAHVQALEQEHTELDDTLQTWIEASANPFVRQVRQTSATYVWRAWEARIVQRQEVLAFNTAALAGLPQLTVDLPAVTALSVSDLRVLEHLPELIGHLPNLQRLELINLPLTTLPEQLLELRTLRLLDLSGTQLTADSLAPLGRLAGLQTLILREINVPSFEWTATDMARMTASGTLQSLTIEDSAAVFGPGVFAELARVPQLTTLSLNRNMIELSAQDVIDLAQARELRSLDLSNNPLVRAPDVSHMHQLEEIDLRTLQAPITEWPHGLETLGAVQTADLRYLALTTVPEGAGLTRGLRMSGAHLPDGIRERFEQEMVAAGNDQIRSPQSSSGSEHSGSGSSDEHASGNESDAAPSPSMNTALQDAPRLFEGLSPQDHARAMQLLTPGDVSVTEFFALLLRIDVSHDARQPGSRLRERIQALIRGAFAAQLRRALNEQARQAVTCVDRDALVFSQMENLLHADQALGAASDKDAADSLIALALSHWRVHRLKEYVTVNIHGWRQQGHVIDYSEIELYFRIALAERLGLRDQPATQVYTSYTLWVTPAMLDAAYDAVLAPQSALLPGYLHEQPYWQRYLEYAYAPQVEAINQWRNRIGEYLDAASSEELPPALSEVEQQRLRQVLIDSQVLGPLEPLPERLTLNSSQYRNAYAALLQRVEGARLAITQAILEPHAGPSTRP